MSQKRIHPTLNLPVGEWIAISWQTRTGSIWHDKFDVITMKAFETEHMMGRAWIMQRRQSWDPKNPFYLSFERVIWLRKSPFDKN